jgi:FMN reductase
MIAAAAPRAVLCVPSGPGGARSEPLERYTGAATLNSPGRPAHPRWPWWPSVGPVTESNDVVVVVGNPQTGSRTASIATRVGERVAELTSSGGPVLVDLADEPAALLRWGDEAVARKREAVLGAKALVVASPTYKASFTGLVKLFLDTFAHDELGGVPTVAVMTGGSPDHSLAVQHHLVPVLVEIGACCPTRGLYVSGPALDDPGPAIDEWFAHARPILSRLSWR